MLSRRDVTRLFIKVFGLLILLSAVVTLPSWVYQFERQMSAWVSAKVVYDLSSLVMVGISYFGPIVVYIAFGLGLMWWSNRIVDRANQAAQDNDLLEAPRDLKNMEVSLASVIGLYFFADGLAELCRFAFTQSLVYSLDRSATLKSIWIGMTRFEFVALLQIAIKLTIAAGLILGRGATVAMLHQAHHWVQKWRAWPHEPERDQAH